MRRWPWIFVSVLPVIGNCGDPASAPNGSESAATETDASVDADASGRAQPDDAGAGDATNDALASDAPPPRLACLATTYGGSPRKTTDGWSLGFDDGTSFVWDDGKDKSYDEKLNTPDLEDTLAMPYAMGKAAVVTDVDNDPGRIRHDGLFKKTLGGSENEVRAQLVTLDFVGHSLKIHNKAAAALGRVSARINDLLTKPENVTLRDFVTGPLGGTFNWRVIAGTNRMSSHSYGLAIDMVVSLSDYWQWRVDPATGEFPHAWVHTVPQELIDAFEAEKFIWGGRWYHYDTMHFEYRPELFESDCPKGN
jgi:hypothetical protein